MNTDVHQKGAYTYSYALAYCLPIAIRPECVHLGVHIQVHLNRNAYYAWTDNKRIGVHIRDRKYLNSCTPLFGVSLCEVQPPLNTNKMKDWKARFFGKCYVAKHVVKSIPRCQQTFSPWDYYGYLVGQPRGKKVHVEVVFVQTFFYSFLICHCVLA